MSETDLGLLLGLVLHDLRNPLATLSASIRYVRSAEADDPEIPEALADCELAVTKLTQGFNQLGWIAHGPLANPGVEDVRETLRRAIERIGAGVSLVLPAQPVERLGGEPLEQLLEVLVRIALNNGQGVQVRLDEQGVVEVRDDGRPVPPEAREAAFSIQGQPLLKKLAYPRYAKVAGYVAARALADALGATLELGDHDGFAVVRVGLATAP